ncbi:MAG: ATP-binding protein [Campylobacterales bacterium]|nr:ATP-binding protein [Campylobacterales bacterium]
MDILPYCKVYIDKSQSLSLNDIKEHHDSFKENNKSLLGYGFSPDFNVWIKFTVYNESEKLVEKILEYDNALTSSVTFYDEIKNHKIEDGLFYISSERKTINPVFKVELKPKETKIFYIKASSYITTLIVKLNIWERDSFFKKEVKHQLILGLFFGAMFILAIYNLFIYFFTKDVSYLFYFMYLFGVIFHNLMYVGLSYIYILKADWIFYILQYSAIMVAIPTISLGLFTKYFLQTKQYQLVDLLLNLLLFLIPISIVVFMYFEIYSGIKNIFSVIMAIYLIVITIYAALKNNRQAYFILLGWSILLISFFLMFLSSSGVYQIKNQLPYLVEIGFILEAIIFSIALADRIKQLQKEKNEADRQLIIQQQNETDRLEVQVAEKTKDLKLALDGKSVLLKELNHRVKNNLQMIVSLLRLQQDEVDDEKIQELFLTMQNRVNSMSHLHELLYRQDNIAYLNPFEYFDDLIDKVRFSYETDVEIDLFIKTELKVEDGIYCGLILNELVTNSIKYAFDGRGKIVVSLLKEKNENVFVVSDNGKGYEPNHLRESLGLTLVNTLAKEQLRGKINMETHDGVTVEIRWKNSGE